MIKINRPPILATLILVAFVLSACTGSAFSPSGFPGLNANQDTAYLAHASYVYAINLKDGSQKWRFPATAVSNRSFFAKPVLTPDGQVLAGSYDNHLFSLDATNGQQKWDFTATDRFIASPLVASQTIFATSADGYVYALDFTGKERWKYQTHGPIWSMPVTDGKCGCIYVSSMDHSLYALNIDNGKLLWSKDLGSAMVDSPAISSDGSTLYVGTLDNQMFAVNAKDGSVNSGWPKKLQSWVWSQPVLKNDQLYFGDVNGNLYAMNAKDGSIIWSVKPDNSIVGAPLVTDKNIYVSVEAGDVYAYDLNGNKVWNQTIGGTIYTSPVMTNDVILVAPVGIDKVLVALNSSGSQRWGFIPPK